MVVTVSCRDLVLSCWLRVVWHGNDAGALADELDADTDAISLSLRIDKQFSPDDDALLGDHLAGTRLGPALWNRQLEGVALPHRYPIPDGNNAIEAAITDIQAVGRYGMRLNIFAR